MSNTVTGEAVFNPDNYRPKPAKFVPVPDGEYELRIRADRAEVKAGNNGKPPFIGGVSFEILNAPADAEDGTTKYSKRIYMNYMGLSCEPDAKGRAPVTYGGGLVELQDALDNRPELHMVTKEVDGRTITLVDPREVVAWLKTLDGQTVRAMVRTEKQADRDDQNRIAWFIRG